jgi:hypothetical protein
MKLFRAQSMYTMNKDRHMEKFKRVMTLIKLISINRRLFWMHSSMQSMTFRYPMYKDRHIEKFKRVIWHIILRSMNRRLS